MVHRKISDIVVKGADGTPGVAGKDGRPIDGVKLSTHDMLILSPRLGVTSDGAMHVAFTEQSEVSPFPLFVYYRESGDGGKSWTEAKNLSEEMPSVPVAECSLLVDGSDRVYVIWRAGLKEGYLISTGSSENLVLIAYWITGSGRRLFRCIRRDRRRRRMMGRIFHSARWMERGMRRWYGTRVLTHFVPRM